MIKLMAVAMLGYFWLVPVVAQDNCAGQGQIAGQVVDKDGRPVDHAMVSILSEECVVIGIAPSAKTDNQGRFLLSGVPVGRNGVFAQKPEAGYPDTTAAIYGDDSVSTPKAVVAAGKTTNDVIVRLGEKAGMIRGEIIDADSLKPVVTARIKISLPDNDRIMLSIGPDVSGHFSLLAPARPVKFVVSAPGYNSWQYKSASAQDPPGVIHVDSGAKVELSIRIQKTHQQELP